MMYLGDIVEDATIHFLWSTNSAVGASITRAVDGTVQVYKDNGVAQSVAGVTDTEDFDGLTGIHACTIDTSADAFYATGSNYTVVLAGATIDGQAVNAVLAHFSIENRPSQLSATAVDAVWDEVLTAGTHDVGYSAGQRLRLLILSGATAQAGTANTITLAATEPATLNLYKENIISIVGGLGAGQTRLIAEYSAARVATVDKAWTVTPNNTSVYEILPFASILLSDHGTAQAGAANSITLALTASGTSGIYAGCTIYISSGTGAGQARLISTYDGGTNIATVSPAWVTAPDNTSIYKVLPLSPVVVDPHSFYVAKTGADANDGLTWDRAKLTITAAVGVASDGDTIHIGPGTFAETIDLVAAGPLSLNLIGSGPNTILSGNHASRVLYLAADCAVRNMQVVNVNAGGAAIQVNGTDNVLIDHVIVDSQDVGIALQGTQNTRIQNTTIYAQEYGINYSGATVAGLEAVRVEDCFIYLAGWVTCDAGGIQTTADATIRRCLIWVEDTPPAGFGAEGVVVSAGDPHVLVEDCLIEAVGLGANGNAWAIRNEGTGSISVLNSRVQSSSVSATAYDLSNESTGALAVGMTRYDRTKTQGTITIISPSVSLNLEDTDVTITDT